MAKDTNIKQCIIIRKDLGMRRGKEIAQGAHASSAFITRQGKRITLSDLEVRWLETGQTKITLKVDSEEELIDVLNKALALGIKANMITDAGRTEFNGVPTKTAVAIGPFYADEIDKVTGHLKLY